MEPSRHQEDRRTKLRALFNGPITVKLLTECGESAKSFSVALAALPAYFRTAFCETDANELRTALNSGLESGWAFDANTERFIFTQPAIQEPSHATVAAPGVFAKEMAAALTDADKLRLRWNSSPELKQRYPSLTQYQEAAKLGLE